MKKFIVIILILSASWAAAQNASTYFPSNTGYKWYYKNIPLDTNNNPVSGQTRYRIDSFAVVQTYKGLTASIVRFKDNLTSFTQNAPYSDTSWYNFQTTNGWQYLTVSIFPDTIPIPGFINFLRGLENWYSVYRIAQAVNSEYVILSKDTTLQIDTFNVPIRVKMKGKRLNDEVVSTVNGNYTAKKFQLTYGLYYRLVIFEIPILEMPDTTWLAQGVWMVKQVNPSVKINLTSVGVPIIFSVPGNMYELANPSIGINKISSEVPGEFRLHQNYPNPFNPETKIRFELPKAGDVKITVFDASGREVQLLVNEHLQAGSYETSFDGSGLTSGVYFCRLTAEGFTSTKKMMLLK